MSTSLKVAWFSIALSLLSDPAFAQPYSIDWFSLDGGGGSSIGGIFSISGTLGQPDAGSQQGGSYTVEGGFWGVVAPVQGMGAPLLSIQLTSTNTVLVSWPSRPSGFNLQQNTNLTNTAWVAPNENVTNNGNIKFIIVNPPDGNRFYRLIGP